MIKNNTGRFRLRSVALAASVVAMAAAAAIVATSSPAVALPQAQLACSTASQTIAPAAFVPFLSARSVTVSVPTVLKVDVTADIGIDAAAELRLAYAINGGSPFEGIFGPANFANHQEFFETRSTFALISVSPGTTSIQPFVRVSGATTKRATLLARCFSIEAQTF